MKKALAAALAAAVLALSPGFPCYQALGAEFSQEPGTEQDANVIPAAGPAADAGLPQLPASLPAQDFPALDVREISGPAAQKPLAREQGGLGPARGALSRIRRAVLPRREQTQPRPEDLEGSRRALGREGRKASQDKRAAKPLARLHEIAAALAGFKKPNQDAVALKSESEKLFDAAAGGGETDKKVARALSSAGPGTKPEAALKPASDGIPAAGPSAAPPSLAQVKAKRSINVFLASILVTQVGVEILGMAMPLLMHAKFGGFSALAHIAVTSSAAGIIGRLFSGWVVNKIGMKAAYIGTTAIRTVSIAAMAAFLMGPTAPLVAAVPAVAAFVAFAGHFPAEMVLVVFYGFNSLIASIAQTAQSSIPRVLLGKDQATLGRFYSLQQWLLEIIGVSGPKIGGVIVRGFGFTMAIAAYPLALAAALVMTAFGLRMPNDGDEALAAPLKARRSGMPQAARALLAAAKRAADKIVSLIDDVVLKAYLGNWIKEMGGSGHLTDAHEQALLSRSTLGWMLAAAGSLAAFATMLLPSALPAYAAMIAFGIAEVIAMLKLNALILSRTKDKAETVKVNAASGAIFAVAYTVALNLAGLLFDHLKGRQPFAWFAAAMIPLGAAIYLLYAALKSRLGPDSPQAQNRPKNGFKLLFVDPVMRWALLGYILLGLTNPLLYQILSQAFGLLMAHGSSVAAAGVASWITSLYSLGGLLGGLYMWRESTLISKAKKHQETPQ